MKIYVDSNVYLDFLLKRRKQHSDAAYSIFRRTISCEFTIVVSDHILYELRKHIKPEDAGLLFNLLQKKIEKVITEENDMVEARGISTHYEDALHIVLAKKSGANLIITRNKKDFDGLFNSKFPEDI